MVINDIIGEQVLIRILKHGIIAWSLGQKVLCIILDPKKDLSK